MDKYPLALETEIGPCTVIIEGRCVPGERQAVDRWRLKVNLTVRAGPIETRT